MTYLEALEILADDPHVWRYRELTADEFPSPRTRDAWRDRVVVLAGGELAPKPAAPAHVPDYPSLARQAWAASKAAASFVASGFKIADQAEQDRRMAICRTCEFFDSGQTRCRKCGCHASLKARIATEHCPKVPPLW